MDEVTKEMAKKKARGMVEHIGYPSGAERVSFDRQLIRHVCQDSKDISSKQQKIFRSAISAIVFVYFRAVGHEKAEWSVRGAGAERDNISEQRHEHDHVWNQLCLLQAQGAGELPKQRRPLWSSFPLCSNSLGEALSKTINCNYSSRKKFKH